MAATSFFLGGSDDGSRLHYDADDLTTHGVIVGMTGSGKTGLGIVLLEEAIRQGLPTLVFDPKGDMTNLALTFPELRGQDFAPWVPGTDQEKAARGEEAAARWKDGLGRWDLGPSDITALKEAGTRTIYTPGSEAGRPLSVFGSLSAPEGDWESIAETARAEIESFATSLLSLLDIEADPLSSREHILLANLVEYAWKQGKDASLEMLIGWVQTPPLRKLGVFELDTFFPAKDRLALAMRLNGLLASPTFSSWLSGDPIDVPSLFWDADGKPRQSIIYMPHLSENQRHVVIATVLSKVASWMFGQPGSEHLRALVYIDEVSGMVPPTKAPATKKPILTLMKQARAFGVGTVLSTQNPVDLDYKAMSNAGTWMIGRLQTERDKARVLEAVTSASGATDPSDIDKALSGLEKRQFLLHRSGRDAPTLFRTRFAMSYLAGPLTKAQIDKLQGDAPPARQPAAAPTEAAPPPDSADESSVMPPVPDGVAVRFVDPGVPWKEALELDPDAQCLAAGLVARCSLLFDERRADLEHREQWEAIIYPLDSSLRGESVNMVDHDDRDFIDEAPEGRVFAMTEAPIDKASYYKSMQAQLRDWLRQNQTVDIWSNPTLKLYSRVGETKEDFEKRCLANADEEADAEVAKLRDKLEEKIRSLNSKVDKLEQRRDEASARAAENQRDEVLSGVGSLLGVLMGRRNARSVSAAARRTAKNRARSARMARKAEDLSDDIEAVREDIAEMTEDTETKISDIVSAWQEKAGDIEAFKVPLEKSDIAVENLSLVWLPVGK